MASLSSGGSTVLSTKVVVLWSIGWGKATEKEEEDDQDDTENNQLAHGWVTDTIVGPHVSTLLSISLEDIRSKLVVDKTTESNAVTKELKWGNDGTPDHHGGGDQKDILQHTAKSKDEGGSLADKENDRNVEEESDHGVGKKNPETDSVDLRHLDLWHFPEKSDQTVHDSADWSEVVKGDEWVHLVLGGGEESLDHDETDSLEHNTTSLEEETDQDELDFTE